MEHFDASFFFVMCMIRYVDKKVPGKKSPGKVSLNFSKDYFWGFFSRRLFQKIYFRGLFSMGFLLQKKRRRAIKCMETLKIFLHSVGSVSLKHFKASFIFVMCMISYAHKKVPAKRSPEKSTLFPRVIFEAIFFPGNFLLEDFVSKDFFPENFYSSGLIFRNSRETR